MPCSVCEDTGWLLSDPCPLCDAVPLEEKLASLPETPKAVVVDGSSPDVFEAEYLTVELPSGSEETYVALTPPEPCACARVGDTWAAQLVDAFVVLDCSASMSGRRIGAANFALKQLYACPRVESLTVIRFGSRAAPAEAFRKCSVGELPTFDADCGATKFVPPLQELEAALQGRAPKSQDGRTLSPLAVFVSDGACHDNPQAAIRDVTRTLQSLDCPLMSVAITTDVRPDVMVALADAHGDLPLLVVHDSEAHTTLADQLLDHLPLGAHETARLSFLSTDSGEAVERRDVRFSRDGTVVELLAPRGVPFEHLTLTVAVLDEQGEPVAAEIRLRCLSGEDAPVEEGDERDSVLRLASHGRALLRLARAAVGRFIKEELPREQAEERVVVLREAFFARLGGLGVDDDLAKVRSRVCAAGSGLVTREQRAELVALLRARRTAAMEVQQEFNKLLETVRRNDMRIALQAYSQQTLTAKHNKRLGQIARHNATRAFQRVDEETALKVLRSYEARGDASREMAPCLLWLCNPYEATSGFGDADQSDWVGRAVFVVPGRVAALNCWRLERVHVRPLNITRSLILQIKVDEADGQRRAVVSGTGYPEFNACLPMLAPGEHVGAVRLAIHCMRRSTEAQAALADIVCGSRELFDGAMVNAAYVTAVLSSLKRAASEADFDGVLRALLTTLDIAGADDAAAYWSDLFATLAGPDGRALVASKDMDKLPDVARAFLPIVCTDAAYAAPEAVVQAVCAKLLVRVALDQTSENLGLYAALGIDGSAFLARCEAHVTNASDEELDAAMQDPAAAAAAAAAVGVPLVGRASFKLHTSKVALIYGLHMALRHAKLGGEERVSRLVDSVMDHAVPTSALLAALVAAKATAALDSPESFVACVLGADDGAAALADLLAACCSGHEPGAAVPPRHDGKYIAVCLEALERCGGATWQGLRALAAEVRQRALADAFHRAVRKVHFDRHKLEIVRGFARRAEAFLREHPWESHRHEMAPLTLGFSTDERQFSSRDGLWTALQDGWYHAEDLQELHALTRETVKDFDFDAWKASCRHFLPGFHIYSGKNLSLCRGDFEDYLARMRKDMEDHYAGRNNRIYQRQYTTNMRAWLEPYARHIFQESRAVAAMRRACKGLVAAAAGARGGKELAEQPAAAAVALAEAVWAEFPELEALAVDRKAARRRHFEVLAREALAQAGRAAP